MMAELDQISDDVEAFRWAVGAMRAAGRMRRAAISAVTRVPAGVRWAAGAVILLPTVVILALLSRMVQGALAATPHSPNFDGLGAIVAGLFALPVALAGVAGWTLLNLRWRLRAGIPGGRLAYPVTMAAEGLTLACIVALWIGSFTVTLSTAGDDLPTAPLVLMATINTSMASTFWVAVLLLVEIVRRRLRHEAVSCGRPE